MDAQSTVSGGLLGRCQRNRSRRVPYRYPTRCLSMGGSRTTIRAKRQESPWKMGSGLLYWMEDQVTIMSMDKRGGSGERIKKRVDGKKERKW